MTTSTHHAVIPRYMNTYRLGPKKRFNKILVYDILEEIVRKYCSGKKYNSSKSSSRVQAIAEEILHRVKKLDFDRYRYVVLVQIIANKRQELETAAKVFWDISRDSFATFSLHGSSMLTSATCFGLYKD